MLPAHPYFSGMHMMYDIMISIKRFVPFIPTRNAVKYIAVKNSRNRNVVRRDEKECSIITR